MEIHVKQKQIGSEDHMDSSFFFNNANSFKLIEIFEFQLNLNGWSRCIRYEIFLSVVNNKKYRVRIFLDEQYNLYPYLLNSIPDTNGNVENKVHSVDMLNRDITTLLPSGEEFLNGKICPSLEIFLNSVHLETIHFLEEFKSK